MAGNTDVDVGTEVAIGTLVASDSVDQALTCRWEPACHSPADALVLAATKAASSITSVSREAGATVKALASTIGEKAAVSFSFVHRVATRTSQLFRSSLRCCEA